MEMPHNSPEHFIRTQFRQERLLAAVTIGVAGLALAGFKSESTIVNKGIIPILQSPAETQPASQPEPTPEQSSPAVVLPAPKPKKREPRTHEPEEYGCTSIRDSKDGRYYGLACKSGDDTFTPIGKQKFEDRPYGVFYIRHQGVYMCGYGNDILARKPKSKLPKGVGSYCVKAQVKLEDRNSYFTDHNCKLIKGTDRDSCNDGKEIAIKDTCVGAKRRVYGLFIPSQKSILNVQGKKVKHPFSRLRSENTNVENVFYRFEVKPTASWRGKKITSAVVRTRDINGRLGWGHKRSKCISKKGRKGGPPARSLRNKE